MTDYLNNQNVITIQKYIRGWFSRKKFINLKENKILNNNGLIAKKNANSYYPPMQLTYHTANLMEEWKNKISSNRLKKVKINDNYKFINKNSNIEITKTNFLEQLQKPKSVLGLIFFEIFSSCFNSNFKFNIIMDLVIIYFQRRTPYIAYNNGKKNIMKGFMRLVQNQEMFDKYGDEKIAL